jgi:hypothetical protein
MGECDAIKIGGKMKKYPNVKVLLDDRAFDAYGEMFILGMVAGRMHDAGLPHSEITAFVEEASGGDIYNTDHDHLLRVAVQWVDVDFGPKH